MNARIPTRRRTIVLASLIAASSLGVPGPAGAAAARVPRTVEAAVRLPAVAPGARLERGVALPIRANLLALSWRASDREATGVEVAVRARTARGWSRWERLSVNPEEGPDAAERREARVYTEPLWVGTAERVAVRVGLRRAVGPLGDLRLHLINSRGDAVRTNPLVRALRAVGRVLAGTPARAITSTPRIITRAGWGADERVREPGDPRYAPEVKVAFVHHTAGTNSYSSSESDDIVRAIYRYHVRTRSFRDIGYNFLVDRYGRIFEGRFGGTTRPVVGAHAQGFNTGSTGIALIGTFTSATPPLAMQRALKWLLAWKLDVHHVPPVGRVAVTSGGSDKYPAGTVVSLNRISGHRDAQLTACPGARTYGLLPSIRASVDMLGHPKTYVSTATAVLRRDGDGRDEALNIRPAFSRPVTWTIEVADRAGVARRTWTGTGSKTSVWWNGRLADGATPAPTGVYTWRITARDAEGRPAREATGTVHVVNSHPDGTVLRDETRRIVLEAGTARPVDLVAWLSRYPTGDDVVTGPGEVDRIPASLLGGLPIRDGTLLRRSPDGSYFVFTGGALRPLDPSAFAALGYRAEAALEISGEYASSLPPGGPITDTTVHPDGSLVGDATGGRWIVETGVRRPVAPLALASRYRPVELLPALAGDLARPEGPPVGVREGVLLSLPGGAHGIVSGGTLRRFLDRGLFDAMGYRPEWALAATQDDLAGIPEGEPIG